MFDPVSYAMGKAAGGGGGGGGDITVKSLSVNANGRYTAPSGKAYSPVVVNVPNTYAAGDEGKVVSSGSLVSQTATTVEQNGTVDTTLNNSVTVDVPNTYAAGDEGKVVSNGSLVSQSSDTVAQNGTVNTTLINSLTVNVPNSYAAGDEGKVVSNGALVAQTAHAKVTSNVTIDTTLNNSVEVEVSGVDSGSFTPAENTTTAVFSVTRQISGFMIKATTSPYTVSSGVRTVGAVMYDSTAATNQKAVVSSNASGTQASGSMSDDSFTFSQTGNTVTVVNSTLAGGGYYISGITYNWFAW